MKKLLSSLSSIVSMVLIVTFFTAFDPLAKPSEAVSGANFQPGNIISDANFFNGNAMSAAEIQAFLNSQVSSCRSGYVCLKDYRETTPNREAAPGRCEAYVGRANETAAEIIARVGQACGISQKAMLVLLQKEQSLVTDDWPLTSQYRSATGYGCPDTAPCDSLYYGFFNQVYWAARQFKAYALYPGSYNHRPGWTNIRFSPIPTCGATSVYIENQATAGLYNYTPYQPNAAALANIRGRGDGCSAYGNRNFWVFYTDWFGDPRIGGSLVRTYNSPAVFFVSSGKKYRVPTMSMFSALSALGPVSFVNQSVIDSLSDGGQMSRVIRNPNGHIFYVDGTKKHKFMTCNDVSDFGVACGGSIPVSLDQANAFSTSPQVMSTRVVLSNGSQFIVDNSSKKEVLNSTALRGISVPSNTVKLSNNSLDEIVFSSPLVTSGVLIKSRDSKDIYIFKNSNLIKLSPSITSVSPLSSTLKTFSLYDSSISKLGRATNLSTSLVTTDRSQQLLITEKTLIDFTNLGITPTATTLLDSSVFSTLPTIQSPAKGFIAKEISTPSVYVVDSSGKHKVMSVSILNSLIQSGQVGNSMHLVADGGLSAIPNSMAITNAQTFLSGQAPSPQPSSPAPTAPQSPAPSPSNQNQTVLGSLTPGSLVKSPSNPSIYLIDGEALRKINSFGIPSSLGLSTRFTVVPQTEIDSKTILDPLIGPGIKCGTRAYVGDGKRLHPVQSTGQAGLGISYVVLDPATCSALTLQSSWMRIIVKGSSRSIYLLENGTKRKISSWAKLIELDSRARFTTLSDYVINYIPDGPNY